MQRCADRSSGWGRALAFASVSLLSCLAPCQVTTFYGVQASLYTTVTGGMKMDYDATYDRFVVQYQYGSIPPQYATIQRTTKALSHLAQTGGTTYKETLFSVLPTTWAGHSPGTAFVPAGGGGSIYSISPSGAVSLFASGLPSGNEYATVHWDSVGLFGHDLLYADEGTGQIWRVNSSGVGTPVATLRDGLALARPEPILVLGSNPRYGNLQNQALIGQNLPSATYFSIDGSHNVTSHTLPVGILPSNGGSLDCFRLFPVVTPNTSIYAMLYSGTSQLYELSNLTSVPNLQAGDLLVGVETLHGGRIYHTYFDTASSQWNWNLLAEFQNIGFLENVVIAPSSVPVPEPGTLLLAGASLTAALRRRRR